MNFFMIAEPLLMSFDQLFEFVDEAYIAQSVDIFLHGIIRREGYEQEISEGAR